MDSVMEKLAFVSSKEGGDEGAPAVAAAAAATENEATAEWSVISMIQERFFCCVFFSMIPCRHASIVFVCVLLPVPFSNLL
jgi:hypothetical protein